MAARLTVPHQGALSRGPADVDESVQISRTKHYVSHELNRNPSQLVLMASSEVCAALLGRFYPLGLAFADEQVVRYVVLNLLADLDLTLALSGRTACRSVDASTLADSR